MHFEFVDIGSADFDNSFNLLEKGLGIFVEPRIDLLNNIQDHKNLIKCPFAIGSQELDSRQIYTKTFYFVSDEKIKNYGLPFWARGCSTSDSPHKTLLKYLNKEDFDKITVLFVSFETFINVYNITSINKLKIDTEGQDCYILKDVFKCLKKGLINIKEIIFEWNELSPLYDMIYTVSGFCSIDYSLMPIEDTNFILKKEK